MFCYEFECPKGHVTEAIFPMGVRVVICEACTAEQKARYAGADGLTRFIPEPPVLAHRILSPTRTTFRHADRSATKRPRE